jgi:Glycosyl transferases group 1/DUF based on E. rectale Gene description (DUF3880)
MPSTPSILLERNLAALATMQPELHERLCWPVAGEHFGRDERGRWSYTWRGAPFDASVDEVHAAGLVESSSGGEDGTLIFGVGGGELVNAALARSDSRELIAWERDPWILRMALSANDWSAELTSGRLRLSLNADLFDLLGRDYDRIDHPLLGQVYAVERELQQYGALGKRALVCTGTLFVDSVIDTLRSQGWSVYTFGATQQSNEENELVVERVAPQLIASINFIPGMAEFCEVRDLDYLCWEIDPALDRPRLEGRAANTQIFTYRRANVAEFEAAGFTRVEYLALAADPQRRQPLSLDARQREQYGAPVSFVGASLVANARKLQAQFIDLFDAWRPGARPAAHAVINEVAQVQREDFSQYCVPQVIDELAPGWREACATRSWAEPAELIAELCAAEKRLNYVAELADLGIDAWGDEGWENAAAHGVRYRGPAKHDSELPRIYNASTINLDIGRIYQGDIVTMRVFDILACGGFVLAEHNEALEELFDVGFEIESYRTLAELREKVSYYLENPDQASAIAARGRTAVLGRHRIDDRVRMMLGRVGERAAR